MSTSTNAGLFDNPDFRGWRRPSNHTREPQLWALMLLATAIIASSYAVGRLTGGSGQPLFWAGEVVLFIAATLTGYVGDLSRTARMRLVLGYGATQAILAYAYSPVMFRFPDELQHRRTLLDLLTHGELFIVNPTLPVSSSYPVQEILTAYLVEVGHLSEFAAGRLIAGAFHVLIAASLWVLFNRNFSNDRVAALGAVLALSTPPNIMFNALWIYGTIALPFLWLALDALLHNPERGIARPAALATFFGCLTLMTHPVTAGVWLGLAGLIAVVTLVIPALRQRTIAARAVWALGISVVFGGAWIWFTKSDVLTYLLDPLESVVEGFSGLGSPGGEVKGANALPRPLFETLLAIFAVLLTFGLAGLGWLKQRKVGQPGARLLIWSAALFVPVIGLRVLPGDGAEYATRLLAYSGVLVGAAAAIGLLRLLTLHTETVWYARFVPRRAGIVLAILSLALVLIGNTISGWPPFYERVPGKQHVAGFESGSNAYTLQVSDWAVQNVPAGKRVACDIITCAVIAGYQNVSPVRDAASVYFAPAFDEKTVRAVQTLDIAFLVIDARMGTEKPVTGTYFAIDPGAGDRPGLVPKAALAKFDHDPRVRRVYDDGHYRVYDLRGMAP